MKTTYNEHYTQEYIETIITNLNNLQEYNNNITLKKNYTIITYLSKDNYNLYFKNNYIRQNNNLLFTNERSYEYNLSQMDKYIILDSLYTNNDNSSYLYIDPYFRFVSDITNQIKNNDKFSTIYGFTNKDINKYKLINNTYSINNKQYTLNLKQYISNGDTNNKSIIEINTIIYSQYFYKLNIVS